MTEPATEATEAVAEIEALKAQLAVADAKAAESWDKSLRATAELDNVRRRVERDAANLRKFALESVLADLIQVQDSLELGIKVGGPEGRGLEPIQKQFWTTLERYGLSVVDPAGQPFNPELHQAVSMQESAEAPPNQVLSVMQKGYKLHDRLLRPAMVVVAKVPTPPAAS